MHSLHQSLILLGLKYLTEVLIENNLTKEFKYFLIQIRRKKLLLVGSGIFTTMPD